MAAAGWAYGLAPVCDRYNGSLNCFIDLLIDRPMSNERKMERAFCDFDNAQTSRKVMEL